MSVDDELPWDSEVDEPSWYTVDDTAHWDPDDDGRPPALAEPPDDEGAEIVLLRFRGGNATAEGSTDSPLTGGHDGTRGDGPAADAGLPGDDVTGQDRTSGRHSAAGPPSGPDGGSRRPSGLFGLAAGALSDATRFVAGAVTGGRPQDHPELTRALDTVVGIGNGVTSVAGTVVGTAGRLAKPAIDLALHPPLVPQRWQPGSMLEQFESAGRASRELGEQDVVSLAGELIPAILQAVLDRIDLTQLVLDRVDLGRIVDSVDVNRIVDSVDVNRIVESVDLDAAVGRVNIDKIVDRVDIDAILAKVDIDGVVATVDLNKIIDRVDVNAVAATIDIDAIIDRVDLGGIAEEVIDEIDLPRIIRESTDSIASEAMVGVRLTSASADDQVRRIMEKLHLRRRGGPDDDPTELTVPVVPLPPRRRRLLGGSGSPGQLSAGEVTAAPGASGASGAPAAQAAPVPPVEAGSTSPDDGGRA